MSSTSTTDPTAPALPDYGSIAVLAHMCLNALAGVQLGFETLADSRLQLSCDEHACLIHDVIEAIRRIEALSRSLVRGEFPSNRGG